MRGGFITETIPGYTEDLHTERENDWICVEDCMSSYCQALGGDALNICAWYNKRTKYCYFGGQWAYDVPPREFNKIPSEAQVWNWARKHSWVCKRMAAHARNEAKWKKGLKDTEEFQKKNGINFVYVILDLKGEILKIKQPVGQRNTLEALQLVGQNIETSERYFRREKLTPTKYSGAIIKKLVVKRGTWSDNQDWWAGKRDFSDEVFNFPKNRK